MEKTAIDYKTGYAMTVAPIIANGVLMTGIAGAEYGTRDFIDGWDPQTGKHLWRTFTIPRRMSRRRHLAGRHLEARRRFHLDHRLLRSGTASGLLGRRQCRSVQRRRRPGDNLYTCSVLAFHPKTGKIIWHYQFSPNNPFDYDSVTEMVLATSRSRARRPRC